MNQGLSAAANAAGKATNAASKAASSAANQATTKVASQASSTNVASSLNGVNSGLNSSGVNSSAIPKTSSQVNPLNKNITPNNQSSAIDEPEMPSLKKDINNNLDTSSDNLDKIDKDPNSKNTNPEANKNIQNSEELPKKGDKVDVGKQLNEKGEVEDSSTKKTLKAVGRGAAAYFSGGQSVGMDKEVANMAPIDKTLGVVSDTLDKVPGVGQVTKELDDAGLADGVNDALDAVGSVKNGDIKGTVESAKKLKKDGNKMKKYLIKKIAIAAAIALLPIMFVVLFIIIICGPVLGGFLDIVEGAGDAVGGIVDTVGDFVFGEDETGLTADLISEVQDFENLSENRQKVLTAAAMAVSAKVPYNYGSHPYNSGLMGIPTAGLDCAGFVQWALWSGIGVNPGYLTTQEITNRIGADFIEITSDELKPGDVALKRLGGSVGDDYNHTGIYAGNNQWFHASSKQVVRNNYNGFTIYLRYKGIDD